MDRILTLNPKMFSALGNRAYILEQMGRYDEAVKDLGAIVAMDENNVMAIEHLGYMARQKREFDKSLRWYRMALQIESSPKAQTQIQEEISDWEKKLGPHTEPMILVTIQNRQL